jgi:hypothetical protein
VSPSTGVSSQRKAKTENADTVCFVIVSNPNGSYEAIQMPSLLHLPAMRTQHGSPLPLDRKLRGFHQSQILHAVPILRYSDSNILPGVRNSNLSGLNYRSSQGKLKTEYCFNYSYYRNTSASLFLYCYQHIL